MSKKTENELRRIRAILASQPNKNCLGTGYPTDPDQCAPWPIVDEVIDSLTRIIEDQGGE
jgi:hypothetical protein